MNIAVNIVCVKNDEPIYCYNVFVVQRRIRINQKKRVPLPTATMCCISSRSHEFRLLSAVRRHRRPVAINQTRSRQQPTRRRFSSVYCGTRPLCRGTCYQRILQI
ncbi:hypothetical protein J6590_078623 [Homalodisca vitripennis]|nr:hypothetical protein J6590_078623 [Homalodisca vitripennis]